MDYEIEEMHAERSFNIMVWYHSEKVMLSLNILYVILHYRRNEIWLFRMLFETNLGQIECMCSMRYKKKKDMRKPQVKL